jgi:hypothetical protein
MKPSKPAIAYLQDQLAAAASEDIALEMNIVACKDKQEGVRLKIKALKTALKEAGVDTDLYAQTSIELTRGETILAGMPPNVTITLPNGIRSAIRAVLRDTKKGMRTRDVLNELKKRGYQFAGKVEPATRLSTELWRMAKSGQLQKRGAEYFPAFPDNLAASSPSASNELK